MLPRAANYEVKNIALAVVDNDHSIESQRLISKIHSSGYFILKAFRLIILMHTIWLKKTKRISSLKFLHFWKKSLVRDGKQKIIHRRECHQWNQGSFRSNYLGGIIAEYNSTVRMVWLEPGKMNPQPTVEIVSFQLVQSVNELQNFYGSRNIGSSRHNGGGSMMCATNIVKKKK